MNTLNKILIASILILTSCFSSCAQQNKPTMNTSHILVAYFSATGTTEKVAHKIATATGGEIYEIIPENAYTREDLDWNNNSSRSSVEMNDTKARPALKHKKENMEAYDTVFIGYPIWWDLAPRIINTFIESHDLKGKTLIPFATSGSSRIENSVAVLKRTYPNLQWNNGRLLNHANDETVRKWIESIRKGK